LHSGFTQSTHSPHLLLTVTTHTRRTLAAQYLNIPFLRLKTKSLEEQLRRARSDLEVAQILMHTPRTPYKIFASAFNERYK